MDVPDDRFWRQATELTRVNVRLAVTELLMTLDLPGKQLRLGRDLEAEFPAGLRTLTLAELRALLARIDPTPDSPAQSGAEDWADFGERMHYLADFFRAYQERSELLRPPFGPRQTEQILRGEVPPGRL